MLLGSNTHSQGSRLFLRVGEANIFLPDSYFHRHFLRATHMLVTNYSEFFFLFLLNSKYFFFVMIYLSRLISTECILNYYQMNSSEFQTGFSILMTYLMVFLILIQNGRLALLFSQDMNIFVLKSQNVNIS
jgi:hypothetical protein